MAGGEFVDPFLLIITLVMTFLLIFANIYFLAHYSHHSDSFFGTSTACKAVLVSTIFQLLTLDWTTDSGLHDSLRVDLDSTFGRPKHSRRHRFHHVHVLVHYVYELTVLCDSCAAIWPVFLRDGRGEGVCKCHSNHSNLYFLSRNGASAKLSKTRSFYCAF